MGNVVQLSLPVPHGGICARPDVTEALTRGVLRLFRDMGLAPMAEFRLPNGRRADMAGLCPKGRLVIADGFGGAVVRPGVGRSLAPARRKALTLRFARQAAARTAFILEEYGR